ncbi:MAG: hypothetical protein RIE87_16950 [Rhodospirillales bacterium]
MEEVSAWVVDIRKVSSEFFETMAAYLPSLLGTILIVVLGWFVARLLRAGTRRLGDTANRLLTRVASTGFLTSFHVSIGVVRIAASMVFWVTMLLFITAATRVAGLDAFSVWLDRIVVYVPHLVAGGVIILVGYLISLVIRDVVAAALASANIAQSALIGALTQWAVLLAAVIIGVEQLGVDVTILVIIAATVIAGVLGAMALAFGLGARDLVANLIAAHHARRHLLPGQRIAWNGNDGEILEISATAIVIATEGGRTLIPARAFLTDAIVVTIPEDADG